MERYATPRLAGALALAGAAWLGGLVTGRLEALLLGVPWLVAVCVAAVERWDVPVPTVEVVLDTPRCLEGDEVTASITVTAEADAPDLVVGLPLPRGSRARGGPIRRVSATKGEPVGTAVTFEAGTWGVHDIRRVPVRAYGRGRFFYWEAAPETRADLRVYPAFESTRRAVTPPQVQAYAGNYASRTGGEGIEFAEVREFGPGDRTRRINWRVSSRRQELFVDVAHQERNADVVVFIDSFARIGSPGRTSLDLSVRAAAALARHYLTHRDRVGVVTFGGMVHWLTASGGSRQLDRIVDYLLRVEAAASYAWKDVHTLPRRTLPPRALVVALTPLVDPRALGALRDLCSRGFPVVVVDTLVEEDVPPGPSREDRLAHRVWLLYRDAVRAEIASHGAAVTRWTGAEDLEAALLRVPRRGRVRA